MEQADQGLFCLFSFPASCLGNFALALQDLMSFLNCMLWPSMGENLTSGFANNKRAYQPAHLLSLISAFVIHLLESIIFIPDTNKIFVNFLASFCSCGDWLESHFVRNPEDTFSHIKVLITVI